jgi:hypothetical protein
MVLNYILEERLAFVSSPNQEAEIIIKQRQPLLVASFWHSILKHPATCNTRIVFVSNLLAISAIGALIA